MSLYVSAKSSGTDFQPHPAGPYPARCTRIVDLGSQRGEFKGESKLSHKILFSFESSEPMPDGEKKGQPFLVTAKWTASLSEKALMRKHLESWRGRKFTQPELDKFDLKNVLGKPALLNIVHSDPNPQGRVYANIAGIMTLPSSMTAPQAVGELLFFSLHSFDQSVYDKLSDRLKEQIAQSPEYQAIRSGRPKGDMAPALAGIDDMDSDIPF